jgi:hypothetical protein
VFSTGSRSADSYLDEKSRAAPKADGASEIRSGIDLLPVGNQRRNMVQALESNLKRLGTVYIGL